VNAAAAGEVFVGTSGYSFKDWIGPFYPPELSSAELLPYYAQYFNTVEVNTTYYGIPRPRVLEQMAKKTPAGFRFIVKLNQQMTHDRATGQQLYREFLDAVQPLKDAGKYHGLLAQFPWSFRRDDAAKGHVETLRARLPGETLWVEFRHDSWMHPQLPQWLAERELGYCIVDEPSLPGLLPPVMHVTNGIAYVRFHGRNAKSWWTRDDQPAGTHAAPAPAPIVAAPEPAEPPSFELTRPFEPPSLAPRADHPTNEGPGRYNYNYSEQELREWVLKTQRLSAQAKQTYLFFNNCHAGQAARNAKLMEELLRRAGTLL